jgi:hypothetical protein
MKPSLAGIRIFDEPPCLNEALTKFTFFSLRNKPVEFPSKARKPRIAISKEPDAVQHRKMRSGC